MDYINICILLNSNLLSLPLLSKYIIMDSWNVENFPYLQSLHSSDLLTWCMLSSNPKFPSDSFESLHMSIWFEDPDQLANLQMEKYFNLSNYITNKKLKNCCHFST